jgi:hypothetical protein
MDYINRLTDLLAFAAVAVIVTVSDWFGLMDIWEE